MHSLHANAPLTVEGRRRLVAQIDSGRPIAHVAAEMRVSRATASKWWHRWLDEGDAGLADRSSRPKSAPRSTPASLERRIVALRRKKKLGPARIGSILQVPPSTVYKVLRRRGLNRLAWMDRPTGRVIRRYEHDRCGDLVHADIKKLGRIPKGGGHKKLGRHVTRNKSRNVGYGFVHSAVDDHSRIAYSEVLPNERADTAIAFMDRAVAFFAGHGITIHRILTDNGSCYRSRDFNAFLTNRHIHHAYTRPWRPQTNGKVERFNRTLLDEWAYVRLYRSEGQRVRALAPGSTSTTTTEATPLSEANHPSAAPTTSRRNTARWIGGSAAA